MSRKSNSDVEKNLVDFDGTGKYSDPELDMGAHIVPTALTFFTSDKLGKAYENDLFVASATGNIFRFELSDDRTELDLRGDLGDKLADNFNQLGDTVFASGVGIITDLEVGPDGYLYGTTYGENGSIFRLSAANIFDNEDILDIIKNP